MENDADFIKKWNEYRRKEIRELNIQIMKLKLDLAELEFKKEAIFKLIFEEEKDET